MKKCRIYNQKMVRKPGLFTDKNLDRFVGVK